MLPLYEELSRLLRCNIMGYDYAGWAALRLPETLHPEDRMPIQAGRIASAFREALTNRRSIGYTLAITAISGALFGFINSSQQIFFDVFHAPGLFTAAPWS